MHRQIHSFLFMQLNNYKVLNFLLFTLPLSILIPISLYELVMNGFFSVFPYKLMHNLSFAIICIAYLLCGLQYRHVPQPRRALLSLSFIITALYFSGIFWETLAHWASGTLEPNMWVFYFNTLVGVGLVCFLVKGKKYFKFNIGMFLMILLAISVYLYMWYNGFFQRDVLYNLGGPNPIEEPIWLIHKLTAIPMFSFSFQNKPENKTVDWRII